MGILEDLTEKMHNGYFVDLFVRKSNNAAINMYKRVCLCVSVLLLVPVHVPSACLPVQCQDNLHVGGQSYGFNSLHVLSAFAHACRDKDASTCLWPKQQL